MGEVAARAMPVCGDADLTRMMRSHEIDERGRPAEWAVDPGLAGPLHHLEYDLVVGARDDILDDRAAGNPSDTDNCRPLWLGSKIDAGGDHRLTLLRQENANPVTLLPPYCVSFTAARSRCGVRA